MVPKDRHLPENAPDGEEPPRKSLDSEAFVSLVLTYDTRIRGFITSLMLPTSDADDVYQSTCMAALRKLSDFHYDGDEPDEGFVRWICTIAKYEVLIYYRRQRTGKVTFSTEVVEQLADLQLEQTEQIEYRIEALSECIDALGDREKMLIRMRYGNGIPVAEIGKKIGRTANGVYKALERVRARLLNCIQAKLRADGIG